MYNDNQPTRSSSQDISMVDIEYSDEISIKDANSVLQLVDDSGHGPPTPSNSRTMPGVAVPQSPENFSGDGQSGNNPLWILSGIIAKDDQPTVPLPKFHTSEGNYSFGFLGCNLNMQPVFKPPKTLIYVLIPTDSQKHHR